MLGSSRLQPRKGWECGHRPSLRCQTEHMDWVSGHHYHHTLRHQSSHEEDPCCRGHPQVVLACRLYWMTMSTDSLDRKVRWLTFCDIAFPSQ
jgi:hypothetical protein